MVVCCVLSMWHFGHTKGVFCILEDSVCVAKLTEAVNANPWYSRCFLLKRGLAISFFGNHEPSAAISTGFAVKT